MAIKRTVVMMCIMILMVMGTTAMAAKPFPFDVRPDEVCCYPGYPCCDVPIPPADDDDDSATVLAPSPSSFLAPSP